MTIDSTTKVYLGGVEQVKIIKNGVTIWEKDAIDYFYIENTHNGQNTITLKSNEVGLPDSGSYATSVSWSKDKSTWTTITLTTTQDSTFVLEQGEKVYFRNDSGKWNVTDYSGNTAWYNHFTSTQTIATGGDITTLLKYTSTPNVLPKGCFYNLFTYCTKLTTAPALPFNNLSESCYRRMFYGCSNLTATPTLPATTLQKCCYMQMFYGCSSLTTATTLPATTMKDKCYFEMFRNCTNLATAPALPATTLEENCYNGMFYSTAITTAPELPATILVTQCYQYMFYNCTNLNSITMYANNISATQCIQNWVSGVAATGTFLNYGNATYTTGVSGIPTGWKSVKVEYFEINNVSGGQNTITFTSETAGSPSSSLYTTTVEYSKDKTNWTTITFDTSTPTSIQLGSGEKLYLRNDNGKWNYYNSDSDYFTTTIKGSANHFISGSLDSLLDYKNNGFVTQPKGAFCKLCYLNNGLYNISSLKFPSQAVSDYEFKNAFASCKYIMAGPRNLPSTTLGYGCYSEMFLGCSNLGNVPTLPATTLSDYCYRKMFRGCSTLTSAPALPATTATPYCYNEMFYGCSSLTTPPALPATTISTYSYGSMFQDCSALTTAPELPAKTVESNSYRNLFKNCRLINEIRVYADTVMSNGTYGWLTSVASSGTFYNLGTATYTVNSANGIPRYWEEYKCKLSNVVLTNTTGTQYSVSANMEWSPSIIWETAEILIFDQGGVGLAYLYFSQPEVINGVLTPSMTMDFVDTPQPQNYCETTLYDDQGNMVFYQNNIPYTMQ